MNGPVISSAPEGGSGEAAASAALLRPPAIPDYELVRQIGVGGYGEVWLARSTATGALRAVKFVRRATFGDSRPFEREFAGLKKFEAVSRAHPSQLALFHVGRDAAAGWFYYVMELADAAGPVSVQFSVSSVQTEDPERNATASLKTEHLKLETYVPRTLRSDFEAGRLPAARVLELGLALSEALAHLHGHGLVHRDVKPANLIFVNGRPKLADIGLVTDASDARSFVGTEGYLPPEGPGTPAADIFALGKVLYEALTGLDRRQFPELPTDLRQWSDAALAFELNAVLVKACAADARERYPGAEAMKVDLERLGAGKSVKRRQANVRLTKQIAKVAALATFVAGLSLGWKQRLLSRPPPSQNFLEQLGTTNLLAREQFLQGMLLSEKAMEPEARSSFRRATKLDPNFVRAHARYGRSLLNWDLVLAKGPTNAFADAEVVIRRAIALDPKCGDAWAAMGILRMIYGASFREAEECLRRGIELMTPDLAPWDELSQCLAYRGKTQVAVEVARRGLSANPTRLWPRLCLGQRLLEAGAFSEAAAVYRETITLFPEVSSAHLGLGDALELGGDTEGAAKAYLEWRRLDGDSEAKLAEYRTNFSREGSRAFWRPDYDELLAGKRPPLSLKLMGAAEIFAVMDDKERAFSAINGAFEHGWNLGWLRGRPYFASLRQDPRFQGYLDRLARMERQSEQSSERTPSSLPFIRRSP